MLQGYGRHYFAASPNVYTLKTYLRYLPEQRTLLLGDEKVTVQNISDVPCRDLLECHWRVAEILNACGMGEVNRSYYARVGRR